MPNLQGTVGEGGTNEPHEVALVQVMLRLVKNAKGASYFGGDYSGTYDNTTRDAIVAYQTDKNLLPAKAAQPAKLAAVQAEKQGLVSPAGATYKGLVSSLPASHAAVRVQAGVKTVYLEASAADAGQSAKTAGAELLLNANFRANVAALINTMYATHKIALWVEPVNGRTRGFEQQNGLLAKGSTKAGPGESNHNWGFAVDIGFKGFKWLQGDTAIKSDDYWLNALAKVKNGDAGMLWTNRNTLALQHKLHKTNLAGDLIHLQNFDDTNVSMRRSLAAQLQRVGKFKWRFMGAQYETDMGTGAPLEAVGKATHIWSKQSTPSNTLVTAWKNAQEKSAWSKLPAFTKDQLNKAALAKLKLPPAAKPGADPGLKVWTTALLDAATQAAAKAALRDEMVIAESKRDLWQPQP